ncbi:MAG: FKBP-type peptidyl-prolyl cis-trans isomerase [Geobacteraceae bacterium]|nr:MAG: FKBP-type peptidyl-prolyl cis-trans isomerase [Geobacteraceae bacterium]
MKHVTMTLLGLCLCSGVCLAEKVPGMELKTDKDRTNYSVGYQIGGDFKRQGMELNPEALVQGVRDALAEGKPLMTPEEMRNTLVKLKKKIVAEQEEQRRQAVEKYRGEGREFLQANSRKEGVITLPSGLQYKVLKEGTGKKPTLNDTITVHYRGTQIDGKEFDSSHRDGKPATIPLDTVISGWKEALPLMKEGARWQLFIPADLAFGERGPLADRTVIYEIELIAIKPGQ